MLSLPPPYILSPFASLYCPFGWTEKVKYRGGRLSKTILYIAPKNTLHILDTAPKQENNKIGATQVQKRETTHREHK